MGARILFKKDVEVVRAALWAGVDRVSICSQYKLSQVVLTNFINQYFRNDPPPGNFKPWGKHYFVYADGRIWSTRLFSWMTPYVNVDGYATVGRSLGETAVHRIVLRAFDREPLEGEVGRHLDGNSLNNSASNLRWGTHQQNQHDRIKMGRHRLFANYGQPPSFFSTKLYGHETGLSACFRQWRAESHCSKLHGYPLAFKFTFGCTELNECGWVMDYGGLKPVKKWLEDHFDHKLLVAEDDPLLDELLALDEAGLAEVVMVQATGCEAFARMTYHAVEAWLTKVRHSPRVWLQRLEVSEHAGNSAIYEPFVFDKTGE